MKYFVLCMLMFSTNKACSQATSEELAITTISYAAMTRGSSYTCTINQEQISVQETGLANQERNRNLNATEWKAITEQCNGFSIQTMHSYKAPTQDNNSDRARITTVVIEANGEIYESEPFDEGNPPKELKSLIELILALAESVE